MRAPPLPELPFPTLAYFHFKKLRQSNFALGAGWALVSIYSRSARVRNVICATGRKWVGCCFKYDRYRRVRVCKIRPLQDSGSKCGTDLT